MMHRTASTILQINPYIFKNEQQKICQYIKQEVVKLSKNIKYLTQHDKFKIYKNPQVESLYNANYSVWVRALSSWNINGCIINTQPQTKMWKPNIHNIQQ